jgi:DNA-binding transcriptional MerR regulator
MDKSPDAFRTISEVAEDLDLPQHVLRFWETRFSQIRPLKRGGGRRYYRPDDVDLLKGIRHLLYGEGYTIKGVQRILKSEGVRFVQGVGRGEETVTAPPPEMPAESVEETLAPAAPSEPVLPAAAIQRLHGALDELREADRVLSTLAASEPLRE